MAIDQNSVWEMRTAGSNDNGGFYKSDAGTTDYSQQTTAQATFTNLSTDIAGTQVTDADAGGLMTAQMVGNGFKISAAWYEIKTYIDGNNVTIDRSAGSSQSGLSGKIGGCVALPTDTMFETFEPNNTIHIKNDGTYTLTGALTVVKDGTSALTIEVIGYNSSRGDNPTGTSRPLIACGANSFFVDDYWSFHNFRMTGTAANVLDFDIQGRAINCDFNNSSGTASRVGLKLDSGNFSFSNKGIRCSATSLNGKGFQIGQGGVAYRCVAKDCGESGFFVSTTSPAYITKCISYNNPIGIDTKTRLSVWITNTTIDDCSTAGIDMSSTEGIFITDCIITNSNVGITGNAADDRSAYIDFIHMHGNTTDYSGVTAGANDSSGDPGYADAANGDFSTGSAVDTTLAFPYEESEDNYKKGAVESAGGSQVAYSTCF